MSPITVALIAVASSLATFGATEFLLSSRAASRQALAGNPPPGSTGSPATDTLDPLAPSARNPDRAADYEGRLAELERRIASLELGSTSGRSPIAAATDEPLEQDDLRDLVLSWVAEERAARSRDAVLEEDEDQRKVREFKARRQALLLAQEHGLADWQEKKLFELFFEIELRDYEIGKDTNPLKAAPEEFERRWAEFDVWADRRYIEVLGQELFDQLFGDE